MAVNYAQHVSTRQTPQSQPIPGKPMVPNSAGGFTFAVDCWKRLERFIILGNEGGSYYATEQKLTQENAQAILECAASDINRTVNTIVTISDAGRAPKNDPAIFALAMLSKHPQALEAMPKVCRTASHLFMFLEAAKMFRGRGRAFNRAIRQWYTSRDARSISYQMVKYQQRNGVSHRDVLRLCKPSQVSEPLNTAFKWAVGKSTIETDLSVLPPIYAFEQAKRATKKSEIVKLIADYDLVRECIPTQFLNEPEVWESLLEKMPLTAMVRNLGKMTAVGLIKPLSNALSKVTEKLSDVESMKKARVHPIALLLAQGVYAQGHGDKGKLSWSPVSQVVDALQNGFYAAFDAVEPTNKRWLLALDVSGSMGGSFIAGTRLSCREASGAMALVTASTEKRHAIIGFTGRGFTVSGARPSHWGGIRGSGSGVEPLAISPKQRLDNVTKYLHKLPMGPTDCALPMIYAMENKIEADVFLVYTDNETWHSPDIHPCQALEQYRQKMGIPAKLIVCSMLANPFTIADPNDAGTLDVVGFDTNVPAIMRDFVVG